MYSEGDKERDEKVGDVPQVGVDEGEFRHSRGESLVEYIGTIRGS